MTQVETPGEFCLVQPSNFRSWLTTDTTSLTHTTDTIPTGDLAARPESLLVEDQSARTRTAV